MFPLPVLRDSIASSICRNSCSASVNSRTKTDNLSVSTAIISSYRLMSILSAVQSDVIRYTFATRLRSASSAASKKMFTHCPSAGCSSVPAGSVTLTSNMQVDTTGAFSGLRSAMSGSMYSSVSAGTAVTDKTASAGNAPAGALTMT